MMMPCSLWNDSALETLWALALLMALEQVALASWMIQPWVVLAFLTAIEQEVLASSINWEQVVWASIVA